MTNEPEMTLCPTCGYKRPAFHDKDGTSGFVPEGHAASKRVEELEHALKEAVDILEYYSVADFKGEWNDVDGGGTAREALESARRALS